MAKSKKEKDIGKWFEDQCSYIFKKMCSKRGRMFYSFPDSRSSRGLIPAQPGEYMLLIGFGAGLIELKASLKHKSFRSCMSSMVRDSQYGWHKRWHLSNNPSVFVFYSEKENIIELWDGRDIVHARSIGKPLVKDNVIKVFDLSKVELENCIESIIQFLHNSTYTKVEDYQDDEVGML